MNKIKWTFLSQTLCIFLFSFLMLFSVNMCIFYNMNTIIGNVDQTYMGNRNLMEMREKLDETQSCAAEYLNTRSEEALNRFYDVETEYKDLLDTLNNRIVSSGRKMMEKNIRNMSDSYLVVLNRALLAKRGKNIEEYQMYSEQAEELFDYLAACINELNGTLFEENSHIYAQLLDSVRFTELIYYVILLITAFLDICLIVILMKRITKPLIELAETAGEVGEGKLDVQLVESDAQTEIGIVIRSFNQMVISLKEYTERLRKNLEEESALRENAIRMESYLKDAQLKYLQAQIKPHFLFNTLNAGAQLAMMEGADRTYLYIHKTADFFRFLVEKNNRISTLQEEIELADDYIYILNVRYAGEIHYQRQVDEELTNISVPCMILQPVVENCIKHAFRESSREKRISLTVVKESDSIVVSVSDNGIGMKQEQIDRILNSTEMKAADEEGENGIGLDNVITRLRMFFNSKDVIEITSVGENMGTEVAIYIPVKE